MERVGQEAEARCSIVCGSGICGCVRWLSAVLDCRKFSSISQLVPSTAVITGKGMPNILVQAWFGGMSVGCVLLSSIDVTDGSVKIMVVTSIMEMNVAIIITVKQLCLVGITLWVAFVGGMNLGDVDVMLL